jgi:membrane protease YdiL (CAAX protease family)
VVALTGTFVFVMPASDAIDAGIGPKAFLLGRMAFLVILCAYLLRRNGERWADLGLRRPRRWWIVPLLAVAGFVLLAALSMFMMRVLLPALAAEMRQPRPTPTMQSDFPEYLFWAFAVAWGSAAFGEELIARGFILDRIAKVIGSSSSAAMVAAILLQAALFGSFHLHQGIAGALMTGAAGLVLGLVWLAGGRNLWACFLLHGLVDFLAANGL